MNLFHLKDISLFIDREPGENEFVTAEIYSSETGEWSSAFQVNWDRPSYHSTAKAVACNGIVYWLSPGGGGIKAYNLYDGPTDYCNVINSPSDSDLDSVNGGLDHKTSMCDLCQGELRYVEISGKRLARTLNVWRMKNCDAGKWCLEHSIRVIDMGCDDGLLKKSISGSGYPFACHPFDLDIIYISCDEAVVPYNLRTRRLEKPASHAMLDGLRHSLTCYLLGLPQFSNKKYSHTI